MEFKADESKEMIHEKHEYLSKIVVVIEGVQLII
jgi:hypothetical protein